MSEVVKTDYSVSGKEVQVIRNGTKVAVQVDGRIVSGLTSDKNYNEQQFQSYLRT